MTIRLCTWNINSVRLRAPIVLKLLEEEAPDVLCLQETKSPVDKIPMELFAQAGYPHIVADGNKGYNGVAILSRLPLEDAGKRTFCDTGHARHCAARLESGLTIHNFYVPAGGDEANPDTNPKFAHKLEFLANMAKWGREEDVSKSVLVGDLNIAPREDDVWSHKQLLKVVSHTPVEVEALEKVMIDGGWEDVTRADIPEGKLYSWWSYRAKDWSAADKGRRLDHIWATDGAGHVPGSSKILRDARGWEKPSDHAPLFASFDP
ncbi:exodeoxyribonuclease III [Pontivivens insulae]|uniref:Exodeoxyribonuclease III n=1 Tax=Pontivivens insulae TaxID=1639689 RepID=A0A2R8AEK1_9RHOB|nr:exodeoxyribonuclease III [Pontivivens insulae]RED11918.1 exodeoxyribonuclease-3 [Pontivivens insulae]SPF30674.1 Exodeoxyribonuclease III [Pontivivens insulae]